MPDWDQLLERTKMASDMLPKYRLLTFDFAHTAENGWVMIESNNYGGFYCHFYPTVSQTMSSLYNEF